MIGKIIIGFVIISSIYYLIKWIKDGNGLMFTTIILSLIAIIGSILLINHAKREQYV